MSSARYLKGYFCSDQLRNIADDIERDDEKQETIIMEDGLVEKMWLSGERTINSQKKGEKCSNKQ